LRSPGIQIVLPTTNSKLSDERRLLLRSILDEKFSCFVAGPATNQSQAAVQDGADSHTHGQRQRANPDECGGVADEVFPVAVVAPGRVPNAEQVAE
jgi:hypothetical protein